MRVEIYLICEIVSNLRDFISLDFDSLMNIAENGCTWEKPDIEYYKKHWCTHQSYGPKKFPREH